MIKKREKIEILKCINSILYNDSLDLHKRIDLLKTIPNNNEIVEDIIDELLNQSDIFDYKLSKINKVRFEEWCKKEIDTLRISHNIKIIENDFYEIRDYNRIVIPGSVEEIYRSFCSLPNIKEIEFLEPKNEKEKGLSLISNSSFDDSSIGKIKLPNTLNRIEDSFNNSYIGELDLNEEISYLRSSFNYTGIKKVNIPKSIKYINYCFNDCDRLEELVLNEGLIGINRSFELNQIKEITFPKSLIYINNSFSFSRYLNKIILNKGLEKIKNSFSDCPITEVEIPSTVRVIEEGFSYCCNLNNIILNEGIIIIEKSFKLCLVEKLKLPNTLKIIEKSFNSCKKLEELELNDKLEVISDSFNECDIKKVIFPELISEVINSFKNNKDLSEINDDLKIYLLVTAYLNNYYQELDIDPLNLSFKGTKIYKELEEKGKIYTQPEINKMLQYQLKKESPFMKK